MNKYTHCKTILFISDSHSFSGRLLRLPMEELLTLFQSVLPENFIYSDNQVVDSLEKCMEELYKAKLSTPIPKQKSNELPQKPFGLFVPQSVEQIIGRNTLESHDDLINTKRQSIRESRPSIPADGGPAYLPYSQLCTDKVKIEDDEEISNFGSVSVATTDQYSSRQSFITTNSSRTSFPDQSDVESMMHNNAVNSAASSLSAMNYNLSRSQPMLPNGHEVIPGLAKVDSVYEHKLEKTFEELESVSYKRGVTVINVGREVRASSEPPDFSYADANHRNTVIENTDASTSKTSNTMYSSKNTTVHSTSGNNNSSIQKAVEQSTSFIGEKPKLTNAMLELHNQQYTTSEHSGESGLTTPIAQHTPTSGQPTPVAQLSPQTPTIGSTMFSQHLESAQTVRPMTMKVEPSPLRYVQHPVQPVGQYVVRSPNGHYVSVAPSIRRQMSSTSPPAQMSNNMFEYEQYHQVQQSYKSSAHTSPPHMSPTKVPTPLVGLQKHGKTVLVSPRTSPTKAISPTKSISPTNHSQYKSPSSSQVIYRSSTHQQISPASPVGNIQLTNSSPVKSYTPPSVYQSPTRQRAHPPSPSWAEDAVLPDEYLASRRVSPPKNISSPQKRIPPNQSHTQVVYL